MAIVLPQLSNAVDRNLIPRQPAEVPTLDDIASADIFHERVRNSTNNLQTTNQDLANVIIYKSKLVAAVGGVNPAVGPAIREELGHAIREALDQALQPIRNDIRDMKRDMQDMQQDMRNMQQDIRIMQQDIQIIKEDTTQLKIGLAATRRLAAVAHNRNVGATSGAYEIVPFPNNEDPTGPPHNLPPLTSSQAIKDLDDAALNVYMRNYCPNHRGPVRDRTKRLNMVGSGIGAGKIVNP